MKDKYLNSFPKSQVSWPTVSELFALSFTHLCRALSTNMAARNQQKRTSGVPFSIKALSFHSRTSIRGHNLLILEMVLLLKIKRRDFFSTIQHSYVGVTHFENSEVRIAVFSPLIYQRTDTWMTSRFDCFVQHGARF